MSAAAPGEKLVSSNPAGDQKRKKRKNRGSYMHMGSTSTDMDPEATITRMDPDLLYNAEEGNINAFAKQTEHLHLLLTPNKNTILHINITAQRRKKESTDFMGKILDKCPSLLRQANANDEIPLHLAARYGLSVTVDFLIKRANTLHEEDPEKGDVRQMVGMTNKEKQTALHEAVRFNHIEVVNLLIREDAELSKSANVAGETPLYLAAERGFPSLVEKILETCASAAHGGPNGRTALHAAVIGNYEDISRRILEWKGAHLAIEADKQGWTPLHHAALLGDSSMIGLLLKYDTSAAYMADTNGKRIALHIAASKGHELVVEKLIFACPDCCELLDKRGRNFIHFAAKSGNISTIKVVLKNYGSEEHLSTNGGKVVQKNYFLTNLLNQKDSEGNTPLHLLANHHGPDTRLYSSVSDLIKHPRVEKMVFNNNNENPFDIISANPTSTLTWKRRIKEDLRKAGAKRGRLNVTGEEVDQGGKDDDDNGTYLNEIMKAKETHIVVAALIATVAFAASFTMPGGYVSSDDKDPDKQGTAVLARKPVFRAFVVSNTIAMMLSSSAVFIYIFLAMPLHDKSKFHAYFKLAAYFNIFATGAMMIAFMTGQYAVLEHSWGLAIGTCVIASSFFFLYYELFIKSYGVLFVKSYGQASFLDLLDKALDVVNDFLQRAVNGLAELLDEASDDFVNLVDDSTIGQALGDLLNVVPLPMEFLLKAFILPFLLLLFALVFAKVAFGYLFHWFWFSMKKLAVKIKNWLIKVNPFKKKDSAQA